VVIHPQNPDLIYVLGQDQRVLISEDRGKTWELIIDSGIIGIGTFVEYHPLDSNIMYATTYAAGIFKSTDGGRTWEDLNGKEIAFAYIEGLATDPSTSGVIYSHSFSNGFHYSQDYGETWIRGHHSSLYPWTSLIKKSKANNDIYIVGRGDGSIMKTDNPNNGWGFVNNWEISNRIPRAVTMEVSDNNGNLILVGTENQGIFKTNDGGNTWQEINNGLPTNSDVRTIAIDPNNENKVFAGSINNKGRLWQSNNKGNSWDLLNNEMTFTTIHAMEVDFNNQDVVYAAPWGAGLFKSINGGNSWDEIVGGGESERVFSLASIKVHPENSNILYANDRADSLLIKSEDGGNTWFSPWNPGEKEYFRLHTFEFDPNNPEIFYVSAWKVDKGKIMGDLYRHNTDGGFEEITNELPRAVLDVEVDPSNSNIIYSSVHVHGLFKSTDGGDSWQELDSFPRAGIFDLAFNNGKLYATTNCGELPIYMLGGMEQHDGECGVYVSEDGGDSWNNLLPVTMRSTAVKQVAFDNYNNLYIATNNDAYFASDGNLWIPLNVPFKETATIQVTTNKIYVGTHGGGVYYKQIDASNWNNNGPHTTLLNMQIEVNPLDSNILYASSFPGGIFKSEDGGSTWNEKNFALPSFKVDNPDLQAYYSFLINPYNSNNLFLGMFGKGVYMSLDGANTWMPINKGLGNKHIYNIQLDASGNHLYVGTNGGSVYTTKLS
jgi:photosystem II stability/assembly factor-like uncharacterized protein